MCKYFYRTYLVLKKYNFTFNFCRVVIKNLASKLRYEFEDKFAKTTVKTKTTT